MHAVAEGKCFSRLGVLWGFLLPLSLGSMLHTTGEGFDT
jgi:hypothetical protein